jgi:hypothetical protein
LLGETTNLQQIQRLEPNFSQGKPTEIQGFCHKKLGVGIKFKRV